MAKAAAKTYPEKLAAAFARHLLASADEKEKGLVKPLIYSRVQAPVEARSFGRVGLSYTVACSLACAAMRVAVAAILKDGAFFSDHPLIEAMALEPQVQDILAEAAADEVRFDEASPLPAAWAAAAEAWPDDAPPAAPGSVRRRLRGKTAPPLEWQDEVAFQPRRAEEAVAGGSMKRPAARARNPCELCPGQGPAAPCIFAIRADVAGSPARMDKGRARCLWCDPPALLQAGELPQRRKQLTRALRQWQAAGRVDVAEAALARLPEAARRQIDAAMQRPSRAAVAERKAAAAEAQSWTHLLQRRQQLGEAFGDAAAATYRRGQAEDGRRLRAKFGPLLSARAEGDDSWRSAAAAKFETWCRNTSWTMCEQCHRLQKRPLHEVDISGTRPRKNCVAKCLHCASGSGYPTVAPEQIPEALQHLPPNVLWALRPLEPDVGRPVWARHGYRVHTDMIRFWWRPRTVRQQIQQLVVPEEQARAQDVYYYLMASHESSYSRFVEMHEKFLRRNRAALTGSANDRLLQLPRRALEEEGLECAAWPHLYPLTAMCETYLCAQGRCPAPGSRSAPATRQCFAG